MNRMTTDFFFNNARALAQFSSNEREISFVDRARGELFRQVAMSFVVFRDDQATARVFIKPVNDSRAFLAANAGQFWKMMKKCVYQSSSRLSGPGMNDQTSLLVDYDHIVILIKNFERNRFRLIVDLFRRRFVDFNAIAGTHEIARSGGGTIERDEVGPNQLLQPRARKFG